LIETVEEDESVGSRIDEHLRHIGETAEVSRIQAVSACGRAWCKVANYYSRNLVRALHAEGVELTLSLGREIKAEIPRKILMCPPSQHHLISGTLNSAGSSK
jgi:hypothetical protein